ncbi:MAG: DNA repair protein RecN [Lachnospiraceae bacterium]|nr:DNA repair protein RecN [Lachnospiraceae bacterium]
MLVSLHVKNLALIEETEVFFGPGLNILTGETGAGKSVVLGSVALALGAKADRDMIRTGAEYALIELTFEVTENVRKALEELDIPMEDNQVILQRRVMPTRSICRVNGETVNTRTLKELAGFLIDIHGQHDNQVLLQTKRHLEILDGYGGDVLLKKREELHSAWQKYTAINREIEENELDESARKRELSLASFELEEIDNASLIVGEDEQLEKDYRRMINGKKIMEALGTAYSLTDTDNGAADHIGRALREMAAVTSYDEKLEEFYTQLNEVDGLLNDFNRSVSEYMDDAEFDEESFLTTEERLNCINRLKDKYGKTIEKVLAYAEKKREEVERLNNQDAWLNAKRTELEKAKKEMLRAAEQLTMLRRQTAEQFSGDMQSALSDMNFLHVEFSVSLTEKEHCGSDGMDDAVFLISTNPGEPMKPLAAIASGGELSRIMLALKTITARQEQVGTLIFDEIDAGISGKTAWKVSNKLGILSTTHQIICITHLPQIAAMADNHFYIEKNVVGQSTVTNIWELSEEQSLSELARLSGAVEITPSVLANAKEMKELAEKNK